jgi:hypothetical protein
LAILPLAVMPLPLGCMPAPASAPASTASDSPANDSPGERSVDLGRLGSDALPTYAFKLRNTTGRSILITAVEKSCGCQSVGVREGDTIPAGGSLDVSYALPADRSGPVGGQLTIRTDSDSEDLATVRFSLSATMPRRVWAEPGTLRLSRGMSESATVVIRSDLPGILDRYTHVDTVRGHVTIDQSETVRRSDGSVEQIKFEVHMSSAIPGGLVNDYLTVNFSDERSPHIDILVQADGSAQKSPSSQSSPPVPAEAAP